jgi:hypothetical protein
MPVLLVTYELKNADQDYSTFRSMLHSYPWIKLSESAVVLDCADSPEAFLESLWPWVDQHDTVIVFGVGSPWAGIGSAEVKAWLKERLK